MLIVAWVFVCYPIKRLKKAVVAALCPLEWLSLSALQPWGSRGDVAQIVLTNNSFL